jgi:hypothetical protein
MGKIIEYSLNYSSNQSGKANIIAKDQYEIFIIFLGVKL